MNQRTIRLVQFEKIGEYRHICVIDEAMAIAPMGIQLLSPEVRE